MLQRLPVVVPAEPGRPDLAGPDHPMRKVTQQIAFEATGWTDERRGKVAALFDGLAESWQQRDVANRHEALIDALDRGGPFAPGLCVELGSGTGAFTDDVIARFSDVVSVDLSFEMLRRAPSQAAPRVQADAGDLPFVDGSVGVVVLVNMFLFPGELDRVLAPGGAVVWVSALGDRTPIYLDAESVERALAPFGGPWDGVASAAGWGTWAVFRRATATG